MLASVQLCHFTAFAEARLEFSPGLNVLVGENGSGKSHLLKVCHAVLTAMAALAARPSANSPAKTPAKMMAERELARRLLETFQVSSLKELVSVRQPGAVAAVTLAWGRAQSVAEPDGCGAAGAEDAHSLTFTFSPRSRERVALERPCTGWHEAQSSSLLFLPPGELLSIFPGFQAAVEMRELDFDATWHNAAMALNCAPLTKDALPADMEQAATMLEAAIGARVVKKENRFYLAGKGRGQLAAHLAAAGQRTLGQLAYLIRNGEVGPGSLLFWDTPEAGLNPRLLRPLAAVLAELSRSVQICLATHSLFLLRELDILQQQHTLQNARYFGLQAGGQGVDVTWGTSCNDIGGLAALDASVEQAEQYLHLQDAGLQ